MGEHDCRYWQQNVTKCLVCDQVAEITYMCAHQVQKTEKFRCSCEKGKHRKPETPKHRLRGRKKS